TRVKYTLTVIQFCVFFFSSRRRHTRWPRDWSSDVCSSDLCKLSAYPRVAPAVMALVRREKEVLLARSPHFPPGMYSALAGFVERSEERRVGKECRARWSRWQCKQNI